MLSAAAGGMQAATASASVDGVPVTAVIDTGSAVTLVSAALFNNLNAKGDRVVRPWNGGAIQSANGACTTPAGMITVWIRLGPILAQHEAVVFVGLPFHTTLGVDFLAANGIVVDVPHRSLRFAAHPTAVMDLHVGSPDFGVRTLACCVVPAFSEMLLDVVSPTQSRHGCVAVVEPPLHACAVLVARGICDGALHTVLVSNPTSTTVTLNSGALVGQMTLLPEDDVLLHESAASPDALTSTSSTPFLPPQLDLSDAQRTLTRQQLRLLHGVLSRYGGLP